MEDIRTTHCFDHRRHLTPSQRSMIAARARELYDQAAKAVGVSGKVLARKRSPGAVRGEAIGTADDCRAVQPSGRNSGGCWGP